MYTYVHTWWVPGINLFALFM